MMGKKSLAISGFLLLFSITVLMLYDKQEQGDIEKVFNKMKQGVSPAETANAKSYTVDSLDFSRLDSLGLTKDYINVWTKLYLEDNEISGLIRDSKKLIERLDRQSPESLEIFIKGIANSDALEGHPNVAASIIAYVYGIDTAPDEYSEIASRLYTSAKLPGKRAPQLEGLKPLEEAHAMIILFYDSSCGNCQHVLEELTVNYNRLTAKGIRIVSVSADTDTETDTAEIKKYPWVDKLCDFRSFNGENFKRFGVAATPVMYVIDKSGIVINRFGSLKETGLVNAL